MIAIDLRQPRRLPRLSTLTLRELMDQRAGEDPDHVYCRFGDQNLTVGDLFTRVNRFANGLLAQGLARGDRVGVMLANTPDYIVAYLAMVRLGICQVPININLRGEALQYLLDHSELRAIIAEARFGEQLLPALKPDAIALTIARGGRLDPGGGRAVAFEDVLAHPNAATPPVITTQEDTLLISYTSGTTGAPKGVLVSDKMLQASGWAAASLGNSKPGDVFHFWEPIYHIGGAEVLVVALLERVTLGMVERFSVSNFWPEVRRYGATHMHFLGGVIGLLLKQPPSPEDRRHSLRVAWGGGCSRALWRPFEERFGIQIYECYGMTEASSFSTVNLDARHGSVGRPLPYFDVKIADESGREMPRGERGEFWVREREPNLITRGYFRNPEATKAALVDGWLRTGDVGCCDADGYFYYLGRTKDALRRRGENVSAWEVERVIAEHPAIAECAVIGVANEIDDQDIKIFIRLNPGASLTPLELVKWAEPRMPRFQIPRFIATLEAFPKTPSERIRKELLPKTTDDSWDLERSGYRLQR
jgi:crotonobetaine/carnitine-CoA ligase